MSTDEDLLMEDAGAHTESVQAPGNNSLSTVRERASEMLSLATQVEQAEATLSELKEKHRIVQQVTLPEAMLEVGLMSFEMLDGTKIGMSNVVTGSIPREDLAAREAAFKWLRDNGHADIIKNVVSASFGKGEEEDAAELLAIVRGIVPSATLKSEVHHMTLASWAKEMLALNKEVPVEVLGLYIGPKADVVKPGKPKKGKK